MESEYVKDANGQVFLVMKHYDDGTFTVWDIDKDGYFPELRRYYKAYQPATEEEFNQPHKQP